MPRGSKETQYAASQVRKILRDKKPVGFDSISVKQLFGPVVYAAISIRSGRLLYVGSSSNGIVRCHHLRQLLEGSDYDLYLWSFETVEEVRDLEAAVISILEPCRNTRGKAMHPVYRKARPE